MNNNQNQVNNLRTEPKDVFLHLFSMIMLYATAINFGNLLFNYINAVLSDPLENIYNLNNFKNSIHWALASLIIIFPVYLISMRLLNKFYISTPEKRKLKIRKWLVYLTLFVAALVIVGDLVALIFN